MPKKITIITLVNDVAMYNQAVLFSLRGQGVNFDFLPILHAKSASIGLNEGIAASPNDIVVCCHQDVLFPNDWASVVFNAVATASPWPMGVLGTFGRGLNLNTVGAIWNPRPKHMHAGVLPTEALTLDEHCLIFRKSSGLRFNGTLPGWHVYGADICLTARDMGLRNWVFDSCGLEHLSAKGSGEGLGTAIEWLYREWKDRTDLKTFRTMCFELDFQTGRRVQYL